MLSQLCASKAPPEWVKADSSMSHRTQPLLCPASHAVPQYVMLCWAVLCWAMLCCSHDHTPICFLANRCLAIEEVSATCWVEQSPRSPKQRAKAVPLCWAAFLSLYQQCLSCRDGHSSTQSMTSVLSSSKAPRFFQGNPFHESCAFLGTIVLRFSCNNCAFLDTYWTAPQHLYCA